MRSFEQRIAEIDRRSKEIFTARRQRRKHILTACVPLALCLTLFSAFILHGKAPLKSENPAGIQPEAGGITGSWDVSIIEVCGREVSLSRSEIRAVQRFFQQLSSLHTPGAGYNGTGNIATKGEESKESANESFNPNEDISNSANMVFTITLIARDGSKTEFYLFGSILENRTAGLTYSLTPNELAVMTELLGVP